MEEFYLGFGLTNMADLTDFAVVETHEFAGFSGEIHGQCFAGEQFPEQQITDRVEAGLHIVQGAHASPPKISTSRKAQTGLACPTVMTWLGSPLPQLGVPNTWNVAASPTLNRLRQKVAEMPR